MLLYSQMQRKRETASTAPCSLAMMLLGGETVFASVATFRYQDMVPAGKTTEDNDLIARACERNLMGQSTI
jgi:hypothetical protein